MFNEIYIKCVSLTKGFDQFTNIYLVLYVIKQVIRYPFFKRALISACLIGFWMVFEKHGPTQKHAAVATC